MLKHFLLLASSLCFMAPAYAADVPACFPQGGFTAQTARAKTAREIELNGKDVLLLTGIEVPGVVEARTKERLDELIAQKSLRYASQAAVPDRYGRITAEAAAGNLWLQGTLVEEGLALSSPAGSKGLCRAELLTLEQNARANKAGMWVQSETAHLAATDNEALQKAAGQFVIIEGKVLSVGERDYATFLNFGRNYAKDFAVMVVKKNCGALETKQPLTNLKGRSVRVRGIIEVKTAPRLYLSEPEALEVLE